MIMIFTLLLLVSLLLLFSLKYLTKRFDPFEVFILFLFTSYNCQNIFYLLSSPYERLRVVEEHLPFWSTRLLYGIVFPVLLVWVMYAVRVQSKLSVKITLCFAWVAGGVLGEKLFLLLGVLESKGESWYPSIDFVLAMIVLSTSIFFMEVLHPLLIKEKVIKDEGNI
ncbi:hypothetical protein V1502_10570 [Bacillus sp. SCS-153A]|uniref:hypothetical protein n=1 Tax=Rossellomorea sedimentorum TaxID=3115294 RepID=UPI00390630D5